MKKTVFLSVFALTAFVLLTGFMISGKYPDAHKVDWEFFSAYAYADESDNNVSLDEEPNSSNIIIEWTATGAGAAVITLPIYENEGNNDDGLIFTDHIAGAPDISAECAALKYSYKGSAHTFKANSFQDVKWNSFQASLDATTSFEEVTLTPGENLKRPYGTQTAWASSTIGQFDWAVTIDGAGSGSLEIENFECIEGEGSTEPSSNSSGGTSSSSSESEDNGPEYGYYIVKFTSSNNNVKTAYGDYAFLFTYGKPTEVTVSNATDNYGYVLVENRAANIKNAEIGKESDNGGAAIGIKNNAEDGKNISNCTDGFSYWHNGAKHVFQLEFDYKVCDNNAKDSSDGSNKWGKIISASSEWKKQTIRISDLSVWNTWDGASCTATTGMPVDLTRVEQMSWELNAKVNGEDVTANLSISDVVCLDKNGDEITDNFGPDGNASSSSSAIETTNPSSSSSTTNTTQSSSSSVNTQNNSSSSSSNTNASGGSSSSGGIVNSGEWYCIYAELRLCSSGHPSDYTCPSGGLISSTCPAGYDGNTPIILSHQAHSNMLSVMQNSVNLQIMGNATVQVFDLKGNAVRKLSFAQGNYIVPLSDLPRGLYIVKASSASWRQTVKAAVK